MSHNHSSDEQHLKKIWEQVPPDYYQKGVENNVLQRFWHRKKLQEVIQAIKENFTQPRNILDIGSASGWFLSELSKQFPKTGCVGVDVYENAITYGKKKYPQIELLLADAHKLPFKTNSFDIIICCEVLEHVTHPEKVLQEIYRVVKPTGTVIIEIDSGNLLFKFVWFWWTTVRRGVWRESHLQHFNINVLKKLFEENGFKIEKERVFNLTMAVVFTLVPAKTNGFSAKKKTYVRKHSPK